MKSIVLAALFFSVCCVIQAQNKEAIGEIDSLLRTVYKDALPGASIAICQDGKTFFQKSYGVASLVSNHPLTDSSNFNICSLTKQFTALAILQLEANHKLSLNDKLSRFFPQMNKKVADVVTIEELLTHSSGIIDHYDYANTTGMQHAHNIDVYNAIKNLDSTYFAPGTRFRYSNTAYCLLALIIEKMSGLDFNNYMQQYVFGPAGMRHTIIWNEKANILNEVTGYAWDSSSRSFSVSGPDQSIFFSTEGDGGIYTSVSDYIGWFKALQSGKVFSKEIIEKARQIQFLISREKRTGYGFGWFIDKNEAARKVYHSGSNGGFRTYSFTIPPNNFALVIFSNRDDVNLEMLVQKLISLLRPEMHQFIKIEKLTS